EVFEEDLPLFFEHQSDPVAHRMAAFTPREREAFTVHWMSILHDDAVVARTIVADGEIAGNIVCFEHAGRMEIGYWIDRRRWGKGIATRAVQQFLAQIQRRPLFAHVAQHNAPSVRVLEKCGFTIAGEEKDFSRIDGEAVPGWIFRLG
ncbi:MAG TPA: GNAT family N-acetyltransferase, partial [Thermoanaerobaculia bacterium]|nr:GNAT family N-acetyltransferase [Thermoanaerobaculia bacterium]